MIMVLFLCFRYGFYGLGDVIFSYLLWFCIDLVYNLVYEDYDYVYDNLFFINISIWNWGYFIIVFDWVLERKGIMLIYY